MFLVRILVLNLLDTNFNIMKKIQFIQNYEGYEKGEYAFVTDEEAVELILNRIAIPCSIY